MMDVFQKDFVAIIYSALTGESGTISEDFDLAKGLNVAYEHNIVAVFYEGAVLCGVFADNPLMVKAFDELCKTVMVDVRQVAAINKVTKAFDDKKIDYMPLKGILLKQLYPKSEMRAMGDADILIRVEQYPLIREILSESNFVFKGETDHELVWTSSALFLELHKSVMTSYNKDFYEYFNTGWSLAQKVEGSESRYEFKPEDFYVYIFVHFTKHYRISGIGIKHILDLWVYRQAHPEMDWEYIDGVFKRLKLLEFHKNVGDTLNVWFGDAELNDKVALITNVIFSSGQYGSSEMSNINRAIRESKNNGSDSIRKTKCKNVFMVMFPAYSDLKKDYSFLEKLPILLPFVWLCRLFKIVLFKRKKMGRYIHKLNEINDATVDENLRALQYVGLDFEV